MATSSEFVDYVLDQLRSIPSIQTKKMFGEYALYCDTKVVALICDEQLFVKITPEGQAAIAGTYEEAPAYPGAKPSMRIDNDRLEDDAWLCRLIRITADALPLPKPKKPKTKKK